MTSGTRFRYTWALANGAVRIYGSPVTAEIREEPRTIGAMSTTTVDGGEVWSVAAIADLTIGVACRETLRAIAERRLPKGCDLTADEPGNVQRWLDREMDTFVMTVLDRRIQEEIDEIREDLASQARRFFELLRWLSDAKTSHRPLERGRLEFSIDGRSWSKAPVHPPAKPVGLRVDWGIRLDELDWDGFSQFAQGGQSEPVGHSLIREAMSLRREAPRSAVVLASAALETAVKETIHRLAPDATFLVDETPTPPVAKLVKDYLPQLRSLGSDPTWLMPVPSDLRRSINWLVNTRNRVVHNREQLHSFPGLLEAMLHVQDIVWILDYHCGHDWAMRNVAEATRALHAH